MSKYHDISPLISQSSAVFPMDVPFSQNVAMHVEKGDHLSLSSITTTLHIGAHADAPIHYHRDGECIDQRDLGRYMGCCQVIEVDIDKSSRIKISDIAHVTIGAKRVLFKTNSFKDPDQWQDEFNSLSVELIKFLHQHGVVLVGIDTPSVDPHDSKDLESHQMIYQCDMGILEGIVLSDVPEGIYTLIALPLKIKDADASPVRAILLEDQSLLNE